MRADGWTSSTQVSRPISALSHDRTLNGPHDKEVKRTELLRTTRRPPRRQRQCQQNEVGQAPRGVRGRHERDGTHDPIRELRFPESARKPSLSVTGKLSAGPRRCQPPPKET